MLDITPLIDSLGDISRHLPARSETSSFAGVPSHAAPTPPAVLDRGGSDRRGRSIVIGHDGSEESERALVRAAMLAGNYDRIMVVSVAVPYPPSGVTISVNDDASERRVRRQVLRDAHAFLAARGLRAETRLARGEPASALLAASKDADLLIVGSRKLNRFQRLLLGSVSSKLSRDASCDVLVVR